MISQSAYEIKILTTDMHNAYRSMLQESWTETYTKELGKEVAMGMTTSLDSDDLGGLVPNKDEQISIACQNIGIIGSVISAARHGVTYIWGCYVLERFQTQGIGRKLLLNSILAHDINNSVQITVLKSSKGASGFYEHLGFESISESPFELLPKLIVPSITMIAKASDIAEC